CARVVGVNFDGPLEHLLRELESFAPKLVEELAAAQIIIVRLDVHRRRFADRFFLGLRQSQLERHGDAVRNFVLDGEHVFHLPVVALGPERVPGSGLYELRSNAQPIRGAAPPTPLFRARSRCRASTVSGRTKGLERSGSATPDLSRALFGGYGLIPREGLG